MTKRPRYTDEERAEAVALAKSEGYPERKGAITRAARRLGLHEKTLRRWAEGEQNPPPDQLVDHKTESLTELFEAEVMSIIEALPSARSKASYIQLMTGLGILVDKIQLLSGGPTDRQEIINGEDVRAKLERILTNQRPTGTTPRDHTRTH